MMKRKTIFALVLLFIPAMMFTQKVASTRIKYMVEQYRSDIRGPYKDIRWFCKDGTNVSPQERCPEPGNQRARYKDEVVSLAETNHVFLGQILTTTDFNEFWDEANYHSRIRQYQLENYLRRTDDGWVLHKAQFYRGAIQAEDEENWGIDFFYWLLADTGRINKNFFLIREAAKDIPHKGDDNKTQLVRSLSKEISDSVPAFLNIRIKIHGQPEPADIQTTQQFKEANKNKLTQSQVKKMDELIRTMEFVFQPADLNSLMKYHKNLPKGNETVNSIQALIEQYDVKSGKEKIIDLAKVIWLIRENISGMKEVHTRLALLDISVKLEEIMFREMKSWESKTVDDLLVKSYYLSLAAAGCGYVELWEWEKIKYQLLPPSLPSISLVELNVKMETSRRLVEWCTGMSRGIYKDIIELFGGFEPLAYGFNDDKVRSSILLYLGNCTSELGEYISREADLSNEVMDIAGQSHIRGINPGYAMGELVVMNEMTVKREISGDKIYVFNHPPADLKPVNGIATVAEGNMVSHVQLLARNFGIPNAVLSAENLEDLKKYNGTIVFYAVSYKGTVIMKPVDRMSSIEKKLFEVKQRDSEKITVPVDRIDLDQKVTIDLRRINASHSGILCGPKAANLGQLKLMFPEYVVEGFVIPFGVFRTHMDQIIPGKDMSYWQYLNTVFNHAADLRKQGRSEDEIDQLTMIELENLQNFITEMPLMPEFVAEIEKNFKKIFGVNMGEIPVFLRSDTNMEDLKDFTGAGLNLTLFNVLQRDKILQGIKEVWASPYSERSYKWRQRYLLNPENVYPSILVIPGVNVDYSGVLITKGIMTDHEDDLTIAFSRGVGGAVEGQAAESYLLLSGGEDLLLSPSREAFYTSLPTYGGTEKKFASFNKPILSENVLNQIREFSERIRTEMKDRKEGSTDGPYDIELGFKDEKIWLFQIRPFVENKNAVRSEYLKSITPVIQEAKQINLETTL